MQRRFSSQLSVLLAATAGFVAGFSAGAKADPRDVIDLDMPLMNDVVMAEERGQFALPDGMILMFGLDQHVDVNGITQWASRWNVNVSPQSVPVALADTQHLTSGIIMNQLDDSVIAHVQTLTVELKNMGLPQMQGLLTRLQRSWLPDTP